MEIRTIIRDKVKAFDDAVQYRINSGWEVSNINHVYDSGEAILHVCTISRTDIKKFTEEELVGELKRRVRDEKIKLIDGKTSTPLKHIDYHFETVDGSDVK